MIGCGRAENSLLLLEDLPDVARIDFEGNHAFSDGELRGLMILRVENRWNPFQDTKYRKTQLETDLQAILTSYMRHGYLRARIADRQVRRSDDKVYILIRIEEGDPTTVAGVGVHGLRATSAECACTSRSSATNPPTRSSSRTTGGRSWPSSPTWGTGKPR